MTFLINQAIFILINTLMAGKDAIKIRNEKTIDHFQNGMAYLLSISVFAIIFEMTFKEAIFFYVSCFCNRQLFFDIPLNLLRKLKWDYVSPDPASFVDKIEKRIFGNNGKTPTFIYLSIFITTLLINLI